MIRWFAFHPTAANLLILLVLAAGALSLTSLKRETFPDFRPTEAEITVTYRGASAADVEEDVCAPLWDALQYIEALDELKCTAQDNRARALATMADGGDAGRFLDDIRTEVAAIDDLPARADPPVVRELHRTDMVASVAVSGDLPEVDLERYADGLAKRLATLPGVARVAETGVGARQYRIAVPRAVLEQHGLNAASMAALIGAQSVDLPAGTLETPDQEIRLRLTDARRSAAELRALTVLSTLAGAELRLGQIAEITETFSPVEDRAFLDGRRAIFLEVHKGLAEDALTVLDHVSDVVAAENEILPQSIRLAVVQDMTSIVRDRLDMLVRNGLMGLILVIGVMSLFYRPRFAFWAAMGLPVAFAGAFFAMAVLGLSLNMMTLVALLMAIGIVMDDSIVIADSVADAHARGLSRLEAAVEGTRLVMPGVVSSFLTTLAVFGPLSFLSGQLGAVLEVLPIVLIAALSASLAEAFWVLPHHLGHGLQGAGAPPSRFRAGFDRGFAWGRDLVGRLAEGAIDWRYPVTGLTLAALILTVALLGSGVVQREAIPEIEGDVLEARILMPQGTPLERTADVAALVTAALDRANAALSGLQPGGAELVQSVQLHFNRNMTAGENGPHVATVSADLLSAEVRASSIAQITARWREEIGAIAGPIAITLAEPGIGPQGVAVEIRLAAPALDTMARAGDALLHELESYAGVFNATHDLRPGRPELRLHLAHSAGALGLDASMLAAQLGAAFLGQEVATVRADGVSHEIVLEQAAADRDARADLTDFAVALPGGGTVPLSAIARLEEGRGWASLTRVDGLRTLTVAADVDGSAGNAEAIVAELAAGFLPDLAARTPGLTFEIGGQSANAAETAGSIMRGFLLGLLGIYAVLSFQFRSYVEPVIVMLTIPLALVGVVLGHVVMGYDISMPSLVGAASLAGVVVNNSILLVQFMKRNAAQGMALAAAAAQASRDRFRPILVSVATTSMGLVPLLAETSTQAQVLKPLVISVVFGLVASSLLVLLLLPALYAILDDLGLARAGRGSTARATP